MNDNPEFYKEWKSYKAENFDELFKAFGMNFLLRKSAANIHPTNIIEKVDDKLVKITVKSLIMTQENVYTIGEPVRIENRQGPTTQIMEWEDGKMVIYIGDKDLDPRTSGRSQVREITPEGDLLTTVTYDGVVGKRWFKAVK